MPENTLSPLATRLCQAYGLPPAPPSPWWRRLGGYVLAALVGKSPGRHRQKRQERTLRASRLFRDAPALAEPPEGTAAGSEAARHACDRLSHPLFDTAYYLAQNPDVAASGLDPRLHYLCHGAFEGRLTNAYLQAASLPPSAAWPGQGPDRARKRLLVFSHEASRTGAPLVLLELLRRWVAEAATDLCVVLCCGGPLEAAFRALAPTIALSPDQARDPDFGRLLAVARFLLGQAEPDAALCNTVCTRTMAIACAAHGIPVLSLVHEMPTSIDGYSGRDVFLEMLGHSRRMAVVSEGARQALAARYAVEARRLAVLPPGCYRPPPSPTDRRQARSDLTAALGLPPEAFLILGCGSIQPRKGVDLFLQTAGLCRRRARQPMHFLWIGQGDPEMRIWLDHDAARLGLGGQVHFLGQRDDPWPFFLAADAFFLPSREDPFPQVVLEAMTCRLPVVAFAGSGGAAEALADGAGMICPYLDTAAVAD